MAKVAKKSKAKPVKTAAPKAARATRLQAVAPKGAKTQGELLHFVEDLKRQWMSTIDAMVDPLMIVTKNYEVRKANLALAKAAGLDVKQVIGKKCYAVFAGRKSPCPGCKMKECATKSETSNFNLEHIPHAQGDRFYEVTSQPMLDLDGQRDGVVHVYRDRTEAKRLQHHLAQQEKLASIGLLAGGVAHEINNPLGGILIFSQMLLRELDKESPHYQDVVEIEAATQRCKAIVESLLDFARSGPVRKSKVVEVSILDAVRTAVRFGKVSVKPGVNVDIKEEFEENAETDTIAHVIKFDRNRLIQLFLNLIQNAIHAMPDGGTLMMRASTVVVNGQTIARYEVEDTGVGIAPEHVGKIFDPFFTTKDPGEGTGLGLALCYGIVQDLQGVLRVESTVNVGTRFFVEIPLNNTAELSKPA